jgi:hypothetical protein
MVLPSMGISNFGQPIRFDSPAASTIADIIPLPNRLFYFTGTQVAMSMKI